MISVSYIYIAMILLAIWTIYRILVLKKIKRKDIKRELLINLFFIYFLIIIKLTICKMSMLQISFDKYFSINYIPLVETINMFKHNSMGLGNAFYNVIGNVLLFLPLGFFIPLLFQKKNNILIVALYGFITSLAIETIQFFTAINLTDIDDIIFNTLGAVLGFVIFNVFYNSIKKTFLGELIRNITSKFDGNLLILIFKPVSVMIAIVLTFTFISVYNSTLSGTLSDEAIAKEVFQYSSNTDFEIVKDTLGYKLFLKDEGNYVDLFSVKNILNNRWYNCRDNIWQFRKSKGDYSVGTINENISTSAFAFGKNKSASKIEIKFNGKSYIEDLKENEYFVVVFPNFEILDNTSDVYKIFKGKESKDLNIKFYDSRNTEYCNMKLAN